ncbi:MAG: Hpt domain-containing protein [Tateyamaria sp.]|nr:Hpt domain-containing protein [Tateyamaria sp.]
MIGWKHVSTLREEIGAADFEEVVPMFVEEVEAVTDQLTEESTAEALEENLHFLKGSALSLGFFTLSAMCKKGEIAVASGERSSVDLTAILTCYEESKKVFLDGLSQIIAA